MSFSGAMVGLFPSPDVAAQLAHGADEKARDIHLTLAFLGDASKLKDIDKLKAAVRGFAATCPPISGIVSGTGYFTAADQNVAYASADLPDLGHNRERLVDVLKRAGFPPSTDHGFTPHLTLGYGGEEVSAMVAKPGLKLTFDKITLALGDKRMSFPLTGKQLTEAESDVAARVARILPTIQEGEFRGDLHPRDRLGRWRNIVGELQVGQSVQLPGAKIERPRSSEYLVTGSTGRSARAGDIPGATGLAGQFSARSLHSESLGGPHRYETASVANAAPQPDPSRVEQDHVYREAQRQDARDHADVMARTSPHEVEAVRDRVSAQGGYIGARHAAEIVARRHR